ncbi:MAG: TIGR01777 family protein [Chlamydiae bacterium]|nr:TIGR01777 family protein [Chlamydiota bacterium]
MRILLTGSSGFIGKALSSFLQGRGYEVFRLVRNKTDSDSYSFFWDPEKGEIDPLSVEKMDVVINLAGENIFAGRWTKKRKNELMQSRVQATNTLANAVQKAKIPPSAWIQASAVGFYGDSKNVLLDESSPKGQGFLADVCQTWEHALNCPSSLSIRSVILRFGVVLDPSGGILRKMIPLFKWGLGGYLSSGNQWMSWIALEDLLSIFLLALNRPDMQGIYNACSPNPVTNREFIKTLGASLHRPTLFALPSLLLRCFFGRQKADELLIFSSRIEPKKLKELGFLFAYPNIEKALTKIL